MTTLTLIRPNLHRVDSAGRQLLFHVPSSSLFELDGAARDVLALFDEQATLETATLADRLGGRHDALALRETVDELRQLHVLAEHGEDGPIEPPPDPPTRFPLDTLVLNVNTGCNLSCTYCYKEDLSAPAKGLRMSLETATKAIEMMLAESPGKPKYTLVFFGGEPLSNMGLIRAVVDFAERRFTEVGARVDFTLTTNATLLTAEIIDWLDAHRVGVTVSMDGPPAVHDRNRRSFGGEGTYDVVRRKVDLLLARYRARPVGCRVTLTRGITGVVPIFEHLHHEVGFAEVGFGPVTSGDIQAFNLTADELAEVFDGLKALGRRYLEAALRNRSLGFGNLHQLMTDLHEGNKKRLPCGAGVGLLAVDGKGGLNLCHRFTGSALPTFGDVDAGIDRARLGAFIGRRLDRNGTGCATCRIRNLCSGGCYHESYAKYGDAAAPSYHYCELLRDWIDFGIETYARIVTENPGFFAAHVSPRRTA